MPRFETVVSLRLPSAVVALIDRQAAVEGNQRSSVLRRALSEGLRTLAAQAEGKAR